ncbi:hypothetical protein GMA8713_04997 [Grimontia marina]|uniref:Uncharacterized protein n=1 Tax=Grimontia marina TaxID=646534 RepID=A0A128FL66_9GAMM|nr:hypothetical protein GMA8713_04997 [Grimontia marina]
MRQLLRQTSRNLTSVCLSRCFLRKRRPCEADCLRSAANTGLERQKMIDHRRSDGANPEDGRLLTQWVAAHYSVVEQKVEQVSALHKAVTRKAHQVSVGARHITKLQT